MKIEFLIENEPLDLTREFDCVPHIGETVYINATYFLVKDVVWNFNLLKKCWDVDVTVMLVRK